MRPKTTIDVLPEIWVSMTRPIVAIAMPATGYFLYRPVLVMRIPEVIAVSMSPAIIGSMRNPDPVTETPADICRKVGRKLSAANMPMPMTRPTLVAMVKVGFLKRCSGMSGSSARCSTMMKSAVDAAKVKDRASRPPCDQS